MFLNCVKRPIMKGLVGDVMTLEVIGLTHQGETGYLEDSGRCYIACHVPNWPRYRPY